MNFKMKYIIIYNHYLSSIKKFITEQKKKFLNRKSFQFLELTKMKLKKTRIIKKKYGKTKKKNGLMTNSIIWNKHQNLKQNWLLFTVMIFVTKKVLQGQEDVEDMGRHFYYF